MHPPDTEAYHQTVWAIVRQVPHATVSTYGQVASMVPVPDGVEADHYRRMGPRWVGDALNAVSFSDIEGQPNQPGVPWWRIINAKGGISMPKGSRAAVEQRERLTAEGVAFDGAGVVPLGVYGWVGPSDDWLTTNGLLRPAPLRKPPGSPQQMSLF